MSHSLQILLFEWLILILTSQSRSCPVYLATLGYLHLRATINHMYNHFSQTPLTSVSTALPSICPIVSNLLSLTL